MKPHMPPSAPPRTQRDEGMRVRGKRFWNRQMEPQDVPIAPVRKADVLSTLLARALNSCDGSLRNFLHFGRAKRV